MPRGDSTLQCILIALICVLGAACSSSTTHPETLRHHVFVDLSSAWDRTPWIPTRDERGARLPEPDEVILNAAFRLPASLLGRGSILRFEGLSWTASVSVNGESLPPITGGPGPSTVDIGSAIRPGENTIRVHIEGGENVSPLLVGLAKSNIQLRSAPQLILRPEVGLATASVRLTDAGLRLQAKTRNAPNGTQVRFEAWRDGVKIADWGQASVHRNQALLDSNEWDGPLWPGTPEVDALFWLRAVLIDKNGDTLDDASWRTGLKRLVWTQSSSEMNGRPLRLLGLRNHDSGLLRGLQVMAPTGLNLVEFHGLIPTLAEMQLADELGVNLTILPRCDGRIQANMAHVQQESHTLHSQDTHIINHTLHAPSVLMWSTEGGGINRAGESVGRAIIKNMKSDPMERPVAGWDFPSFAVPVEGPNTALDDEQAFLNKPFWVLEFHLTNHQNRPSLTTVANAVKSSFARGAVGGVLPGAEETNPEWASSWARYTSEMKIPPLHLNGRRSRSRVEISGAAVGDMVTVRAPGTSHLGFVINDQTPQTLGIWHDGPATLWTNQGDQSILVTPGTWNDLQWMGTPTRVQVQP